MDYEEIANVNTSSHAPVAPSQSKSYVVHEITFSIFTLFAVTANILIIYTIFRFRRMRTAPNVFIAQWAIADLCSFLLLPSLYRLATIFRRFPLPYEFVHFLYHGGTVMHDTTIWFVTLVIIDWVIAAYFPAASKRFRTWYKFVLGIIWMISLTFFSASVYICWKEEFSFCNITIPILFTTISICLALLLVVGVQITRLIQKLRKRPSGHSGLNINLATAFVSCWILAIFNILLTLNFAHHHVMIIVSLCFVYSNSLVNFGLLYGFNNDFHACVKQVVSCRRIKYEEDLTESVSVQTNVNSNSVNIDFGTSRISERSPNR